MDPELRRPTDDAHGLDRMTIRYLDGTTTASPLRAQAGSGLDAVPDDQAGIPTGQLLAALSTALDLTEGQLPGHSLRTCFLALRVADAVGLPALDRRDLFHAAFLKDAGCSSNAAAVTRIFGGDDQILKGRQATTGRSLLAQATFAIRNLPASEPLPRRLRRLIGIGLAGRREQRHVEPVLGSPGWTWFLGAVSCQKSSLTTFGAVSRRLPGSGTTGRERDGRRIALDSDPTRPGFPGMLCAQGRTSGHVA